MKKIFMYTDGACKGNPGIGGWGVFFVWENHTKELCGGEKNTTNNRMELQAVLEGLLALKKNMEVCIVTDSQYVMKGVTEWMKGWKKNGWKTAAKQEVKNRDLWEKLDALLPSYSVEWQWVKGHSGHAENEKADFLANEGIRKIS